MYSVLMIVGCLCCKNTTLLNKLEVVNRRAFCCLYFLLTVRMNSVKDSLYDLYSESLQPKESALRENSGKFTIFYCNSIFFNFNFQHFIC